jgi:hypothetical protein
MRDRLTDAFSLLALVALGLTAGAMLAEATILVPYWQSLSAEQFFNWYQNNAELLVDFYSPLEITSAILSLIAAILNVVSRRSAWLWVLAAMMSLVVIGLFFVYFKDANAGFANRTVVQQELPAALVTWGAWQWTRVAFGVGAFVAATVAVMRRPVSLSCPTHGSRDH